MRPLILLAAIVLPLAAGLAGCVEQETPSHHLHVAGPHLRFNPDGSVTATASVVNLGPVEGSVEMAQARLFISWWQMGEGDVVVSHGASSREIWTFAGSWPVGRAETISLEMPAAAAGAWHQMVLSVSYSAGSSLEEASYVAPCFDGASFRTSPEVCAPEYRLSGLRLDPNPAAWHDRMIACCGWLPPGLDVVEFGCGRVGGEARCAVTLHNWQASGRVPVVGWRVVDVMGEASEREVARGMVDAGGGEIVPGAERVVSFSLPLAVGAPGVGAERRVEVLVDTTVEHEGNVTARAPMPPFA